MTLFAFYTHDSGFLQDQFPGTGKQSIIVHSR